MTEPMKSIDKSEQLKGLTNASIEGFRFRRLFSRSPIPDRVGVSNELLNIIISTRTVLLSFVHGGFQMIQRALLALIKAMSAFARFARNFGVLAYSVEINPLTDKGVGDAK